MKSPAIKFQALLITFILLFSGILINLNAVYAEESNILVETDLRIELLTIVQYLGDSPLLTRFDFPYRQELIKKFLPYKSHFVVTFLKTLSEHGFSYDAPPTAMMHLSEPPELKVVVPITDYVLKRAGGQENLDKFVDALRVFVKETNFISVMEEYKPYFQTIETKTKQKFDSKKYLKQLEDYYGYGQHSYHIILGSFIHCGGYGPSIAREDGTNDIFSIIGPCDVIEGYPDFGGATFFESLIFHEFSHSFINPLTTEHIIDVNACKKLFTPITEDMLRSAYGSWETCLNEHLGRIFTARIALANKGLKIYEQELENDIRLGFVYLPYLDKLYQTYEQNRSIYPTIRDFYPEIMLLIQRLNTYPSIPTGFKISTTGIKGVGLEWIDNARDEDGFRIYRSNQKQSGYQMLAVIPKNSKEYDDNTIEPGGIYWYKISAFNKNGEMETYPIHTKIQFSEPTEPTNFHLESIKGNIVTLGWEYKSKCSGFVLYESPDQKEIQKVRGDLREIVLNDVSYGKHTYMLKSFNQSGEEIKFCKKEPLIEVDVLPPQDNIIIKLKVGENDIFIKDGRVFVPIRIIAEAFFAKVSWVGTEQKITIRTSEVIIELWLGKSTAKVNGIERLIDPNNSKIMSFPKDGRTGVPLRFVGESLGCEMKWDAKNQEVTIINKRRA